MSEDNLVKITGRAIHIDKPIHLGDTGVIEVEFICVKESKEDDEFKGKRNVAELKGIIAEVRSRDGHVISQEEQI